MASGVNFRRIWAEEVVGDDVACAGCGYNLRSLKQGAVCPECGQPVSWSLVMCHFRAARMPAELDRNWVRRLAEGFFILIASVLVSLILCLCFSRDTWVAAGNMVFMIGLCCGWALAMLGIWRVTAPAPDGDYNSYDAFWRQSLRFTAALYAAVPIIFAASAGASFEPFTDLVTTSCALLGAICTFFLYQHMAQLARRTRSLWLQLCMIAASLVVSFFMMMVYDGSLRELRGVNYAINFLLLNPLAPLAPPETLGVGMANIAGTLSQQDRARGELLLFNFPILIMLVNGIFAGRLLRIARRPDPGRGQTPRNPLAGEI
jgi:hypothetical protein